MHRPVWQGSQPAKKQSQRWKWQCPNDTISSARSPGLELEIDSDFHFYMLWISATRQQNDSCKCLQTTKIDEVQSLIIYAIHPKLLKLKLWTWSICLQPPIMIFSLLCTSSQTHVHCPSPVLSDPPCPFPNPILFISKVLIEISYILV